MASSARHIRVFGCCLAAAAMLTGCIFKPDFSRPVVITDNNYRDTPVSSETIANLKWWELFNDKPLLDLIQGSLNENRDLKVAMARVEQARALVGVVRPDQFPRIDAAGGASRTATAPASPVPFPIFNEYSLLAPLNFEVDIWGRYASATESKRAEMLAADETYRAVTLTLVAEVALTYLDLLNVDRQIIIADRTIKVRNQITNTIYERWKGGYTNKLDLNQTQVQQQEAVAALIALQRKQRLLENAMSVLLGHTPHAIPRSSPDTNPLSISAIPAGAPAMLLERRPDVRAAEEQARAALMEVGIARSLQYPQVSVLGILGLNSGESSTLFSADGKTWSIGGQFLGPLIDLGKSWSRTSAAEANAEAVLKAYEQVVLTSVREVEDAMISIRTYNQEYKVRDKQVAAASSGDVLSRARYDNGIASFLEVLNTQATLFSSSLARSDAQQLYLASIVQLYKALGGGWETKQGDVELPARGWEFYQ